MTQSGFADPIFTLTTGPVDAYPAVLRALSRPVLYDYDPAFLDYYESVAKKAQRAFRSQTVPVILQGEPVLGLEAAAASLLTRSDTVLNLASGVYGAGFAPWARRHCGPLFEIRVPFNEAIDPQSVAEMLKAHPEITVVAICHHDTPSGTINPVREIGRIVAEHGALLIVDAVSSFGGMRVLPEEIHADLLVTGPNKCLGCPPGLSLLHVSDAAWAKMKANPDAPRASILSILDWEHAWRADKPFPFTPSVSEIYGLGAALDLYLDEGEEAVWARHDLTARACRAGMIAAGLRLWPASEDIASPTATALRVPDGIDETEVRVEARRRYGVVLSSGRGETLGKLIRIGHMGPTARPIYAVVAITAVVGTLSALGVQKLDVGAGVAAAMAVIDAAV